MGRLVDLATFGIATDVERENNVFGKLAALLKDRIDGVSIDLGMLGHGLEVIAYMKQLVHHKLHVAQGRVIGGHIE